MIPSLMWLSLLSCSGDDAASLVPRAPQALETHECGVCGMVVREQPAPRAQLLHRDGERAFFCSVGDLRAALAAPNSHGAAVGVWVESLPADFDPSAPAGAALPWIPAEQAHWVVGFERLGVMGRPALSFAQPDTAATAAAALGARVVDWDALKQAPFNQDPP